MKPNLDSFIVETKLAHLDSINNSSGNPTYARERLFLSVLRASQTCRNLTDAGGFMKNTVDKTSQQPLHL